MARIQTYSQDTTLDLNDKLIGSDSTNNSTKNFSIESLLDLANSSNSINHFDGVVFKALDYNVNTAQYGIITTGTGTYSSTNFSTITQFYISKKNIKNSNVEEYLETLTGYDIRVTSKTDINNFGVYRVDSLDDGGTYQILNVTVQHHSGQLVKDKEYFVSTLGNNLANLNSFSVTSTNDVTSAGSGQIITDAERTLFNTVTNKVNIADIKDNLLSSNALTDAEVPLSAYQGYILKGYIDDINTLLTSDNVDLDTLQEVVDFIEANKSTLDSLTISNISGLQTALDGKVDVIVGKGLSANDFTDALLTKLQGISDSAEVNVQADWNETDSALDSFIQNKPTDLTVIGNYSVTGLNDVTSAGSGAIITSSERTKLSGIAAGAEVNVQANWDETNTSSDAFIQNKPSIASSATTLTINGTTNEIEVSGGAQDLTTNRSWTVGLPNDVTISNDLTVTGDITAASVDAGNILSLDTAYSGTPTQANAIYYTTENSHDVLNFRYHSHTLKIDTLTEVIPSGITSGGTLSAANTTQFTIAAGTGVINDLNKESGATEPYPEIQYISWSQQTITVSNLDALSTEQKNSWVYIDENGTVQQQATTFTDAQIANKIIIGSVVHSSGTIDFVKTFPITAYAATAQLAEFARMFGPMKKSGHKITANGANLSIDRAAGTAFAFGRNYTTDPNNPSIVTDNAKTTCAIHRYYSDGSTGHTKDTNAGAGYNTLDVAYYDDGSGTLAAMNTAKFSVQRLYFFPTTPNVVVAYYGKDFYDNIDDAEKSYLVEDFTEADNTASQAIYLGAIIVKGSATDLSDSGQAKILTAGIFRSLAAVNLGGTAAAQALIDLTDVDTSGVANDYILRYNGTGGQWEAEALTTDGITEGSTNLYDQTVVLTEGNNITVTGTYPNFTIASAHPTISGASTTSNTGQTYIQNLTIDSNGHITGTTSATVPAGSDTTYDLITTYGTNAATFTLTASSGDTDAVIIDGQGSNTTGIVVGGTSGSITISHADTSSISDINNSGYTFIQDLTFDGFGHVTGATSAAISTAAVANGSTSLVTGDQVYDFVIAQGYSGSTGTVDTANSPGAGEFAKFTDANTIEGRTASELKADLDLEIGTDIQAYDADLTTLGGLAKTDGNFIVGNGTTWVAESGNTARTSLGLGTGNSPQFTDLVLSGNLTVNGTTTTLNTTNLNISDLNITLAEGALNAAAANGAGITVDGANATITYDSSNDSWVFGKLPYYGGYRLLTADYTGTTSIDADQLDGQHGSYYLNYNNLTNTPTINNAQLTVSGSGVLGGSGTFTANQGTNATISITHDNVTRTNNTSSASPSHGGTFTAIDSITTSSQGHVTAVNTKTVTLPADANTPNFQIRAGSLGLGTTVNSNDLISLTGSGATTVSLSGTAFTISSTNTTYSAGGSMSLSGTTFNVNGDLRGWVTEIGVDSTHDYYQVNGSNHSWYLDANLDMILENDGDLHVDGDVIAFSGTTSDRRLKDNITTIESALEKVEKLRGVEYDWNATSRKGQHDMGVIAQEIEEVFPFIVREKELQTGEFADNPEVYKVVDYEKLTGVLIEAVKELSAEVKALKQQINS
jgi:galactitol-specific phosphotransferase system IIB component